MRYIEPDEEIEILQETDDGGKHLACPVCSVEGGLRLFLAEHQQRIPRRARLSLAASTLEPWLAVVYPTAVNIM